MLFTVASLQCRAHEEIVPKLWLIYNFTSHVSYKKLTKLWRKRGAQQVIADFVRGILPKLRNGSFLRSADVITLCVFHKTPGGNNSSEIVGNIPKVRPSQRSYLFDVCAPGSSKLGNSPGRVLSTNIQTGQLLTLSLKSACTTASKITRCYQYVSGLVLFVKKYKNNKFTILSHLK